RMRWSYPHIQQLQQETAAEVSSFDAIASVTGPVLSLGGSEPEQVDGEIVSPEYFRVMRVTPQAGRAFTPKESASALPLALISGQLWRRRYGSDPALIGQNVRINDVPVTVIGILPDGFAGVTGKADIWISAPMSTHLAYTEYLTTPQHFISVVARLKDDAT